MRNVALFGAIVLFAGQAAHADWPTQTVHVNQSNCPNLVTSSLVFDPLGRPLAAWQEVNNCNGLPTNYWARRTGDTWAVNEVHDNPAQSLRRGNSSMVLMPDGTPWHALCSGWPGWQAYDWPVVVMVVTNLQQQPGGFGQPWNYFGGEQVCSNYSPTILLAAPPVEIAGVTEPRYLMMNHCDCSGGLLVNGVQTHGNDFLFRQDAGDVFLSTTIDYKIAPDGSDHVVYCYGTCSNYSALSHHNGTLRDETVIEAGFAGTVSLAIDAAGGLHLAALRSNGSLCYSFSSDNGHTWSPLVQVGAGWPARPPSIAIDNAGQPAIACWGPNAVTLTLTSRHGSSWSTQAALDVATYPSSGPRLAFDLAGRPSVFYPDPIALELRLATGPAYCPADFNGDGFPDIYDFVDYVTCFEGGTCPAGQSADFNGDGFADIYDFVDFVTAFETGC